MKPRTLFAIAAASVFVPAIAAEQANERTIRTIQDVASQTVATNPDVRAAWYEYLAARDAQNAARGGYFPKLDVAGSAGREELEIKAPDTTQTFDHRGVSVTLTQMLWDGLFTRNEVRSADHTRLTRYYDVRNAAESAALEAFQAYQDTRRFRELVALAEQNYKSHQDVYDQIAERVRAGISRSVDLDQVTGRLALAKSNVITEKSNLHDVTARFERIVGEPPADTLQAPASLDAFLPLSIGIALDNAYAGHPAISAAIENIAANRYSAASARAAYQPRLDARVRGEYGEDISQIQGRSNDVVAELVLGFNVFNGGSDKARVDQAENLEVAAEYLRDKTCRNVRQNLRIAYNDSVRLAEQVEHLNAHRQSADKTTEVYRNQFSIGQRTLLDLLDTENEAFDARRAHTNAQYDRTVAVARSLASMGQLMLALGVAREDQDGVGAGVTPGPNASSERCPHLPDAPVIVAAKAPLDTDGDGVPDFKDLCPGTPLGAVVDQFGCEPRKPIVLNGVTFQFDSATLLPESLEILGKAVASLLANPNVKIEIAGHTDSLGTAAYNQRLSQARADSVVQFLANNGIDISRLVAIGYGESRPIADNSTASGQRQNRRVEMHVLDPKQ